MISVANSEGFTEELEIMECKTNTALMKEGVLKVATKTIEAPKPVLNSIDELFRIAEQRTPANAEITRPVSKGENEHLDSYLTELRFSELSDFPEHPFRLYEGERKQDMVDSIREKGVLQPLIIRALDNGDYCILSGHNRKYCGIEAGLESAPVIVKRNLSDADALVYVIETNLIQRSFADMVPSEKAAVLHMQHSKMFSQGKRNDIINELEQLSNPYGNKENTTSSQVAKKLTSMEKVGDSYGLSKDSVARYLRVHQLAPELKTRVDFDEIPFIPAVTLSYLKVTEQKQLDKCMEQNGFKVDMRKADVLRDYSSRGKLDSESIYLILNGEVGQPPKKNRTPTVKVSKAVYVKYFTPKQTTREIQDYVEKALDFYAVHLAHSRETVSQSDGENSNNQTNEDDHDIDDGFEV